MKKPLIGYATGDPIEYQADWFKRSRSSVIHGQEECRVR